jgi:hypothetical protein
MRNRWINIAVLVALVTIALAANMPFSSGCTWSSDTQLTNYPYFESMPSITQTKDKNIWLLWEREIDGYCSIMSKTYNGTSWSNERVLIRGGIQTTQLIHQSSLQETKPNADALQSITYNLTIYSATGGTTNPPAGNYTYDDGTNVAVEAMPEADYEFDTWTIEPFPTGWKFNRTANPVNIVMDSNYELAPFFWKTPPPPTYSHISPSIIQLSNETLIVVWSALRDNDYEIYYITSSNNGQDWTDYNRLTYSTGDDLSPVVMQAQNGTIWVVWGSYRLGNFDIYYKTYNGNAWSEDQRLTTDSNQDKLPSVAQTKDRRIWILWSSTRVGYFQLYYKTYNGTSWSDETRLTNDNQVNKDPAIFQMRNDTIWVVWASVSQSPSASEDIYYIASNDNGTSWTSPIQFTTDTNEDSFPAAIQSSQREVWVVWTSNRALQPDGNWDIWYRKTIVLEGDVNEDGKVDAEDLVAAGLAWGTGPGDSAWNARADLNDDKFIDIEDVSTVGRNFGRKL